MQQRPRSTAILVAGRCALHWPALLFSEAACCSSGPSNHLDLEATLWLESFLKAYPGMMVVINHERDLLNNVVDNILHLEGDKGDALRRRL